MEDKRTIQDLQQLQALPLSLKVSLTKQRIRQWVNEFGVEGVYVSFSGGKDSTVLLHLVRELYPNVEAVFCDTGLEYPEIREFVKTFDNVTWLKPKMNFRKVIEKYGYPFISKEVSECVYGARKYLTSVLESASLERTNERTNERTRYRFEFNKLTAQGKYQKPLNSIRTILSEAVRIGRVCTTEPRAVQTENTESYEDWGSSGKPLTEPTPNNGVGKMLDNFRVQRLMGILPMSGKATMENIPNEVDRSMFSCERYQFFLDAPFEISQKCCGIMKKEPFNRYHRETNKVPITAQMASESRLRTQIWLKNGCNAFQASKQMSNPMSFWTEQDVLLYIYENHIPIASVYGDVVKANEVEGQTDWSDLGIFDLDRPLLKTTGCDRTGCMFCGYGCHLEKAGEGRFERMKETHPKQYAYIMKPWDEGGLGYKEVIDWINENNGKGTIIRY